MTKSLLMLLLASLLVSRPLQAANGVTVDDISFMTEEYPGEEDPCGYRRRTLGPGLQNSFHQAEYSYYALHRETPDAVIQLFQSAYDELRKEKKIQSLVDSYLKRL